jgi:hypothetical protein
MQTLNLSNWITTRKNCSILRVGPTSNQHGQRGNIPPRAFRNAHPDQQGTHSVNSIFTSVRLAHRVPARRTATVQAEPLPSLTTK